MSQYISVPEETKPWEKTETQPVETVPEETQPEETEQAIAWPEVDFAALREVNNQVIGWIYIPGTQVNYPIVQAKDNDYYLYRLLSGEYNSSGSIFLEASVDKDFSADNSPIYGHNMKNGTMFAEITSYKDQAFYDEHPVGMLLTPGKNYLVKIFSGYVTSSWGDAWETDWSDDGFTRWLQDVERKSYFATDVIPDNTDHILTFSTCTYENDDARFVVHAVLEEQIP